jgi:hypothetical protein
MPKNQCPWCRRFNRADAGKCSYCQMAFSNETSAASSESASASACRLPQLGASTGASVESFCCGDRAWRRWSSHIAVIAASVGALAGSCMIAVPTRSFWVLASISAAGVTAFEP